MTDALRVLLVGAGVVAERHRDAIVQRGDRVAVVVDPDAARRERLVGLDGCVAFDSLEAWVADGAAIDAAVVASPSDEHLWQTSLLVERGVPVLVEKPHRLPGQRGVELCEASARGGVPVQVGMTTRYTGGLQALRRELGEGRIGTPIWLSDRIWYGLGPDAIAPWYFDRRRSGGGVLVTNGVHALDRAAWLLGEPLELVSADLRTLTPDRPVEDAANLSLTTSSGVDVTISLLWAPFAAPPGELRVVATGGCGVVRQDGSWSIVAGEHEDVGESEPEAAAFGRQWEAFRAAVADGIPVEADLAAAERTLQVIEAAYASAAVTA